jgi:Terminase small subunit
MEAFKQAGYANESAHQNACRLRANESVAARIEELRARNAEKCQLSRDEAVQYLVEILKTPISEVTADHRLAQSYDPKSGKIELPNKLGALQLLAKMCGWQAPEKHEIEHGYKAQQELISHRTAARAWSDTQQSECWISWRDRAELGSNAAFVLVRVRYWNAVEMPLHARSIWRSPLDVGREVPCQL